MVLRVRLLRGGRKNRPHYSVVIANSQVARDGKFLEKVGTYDPMLPKDNPLRIIINEERINYWFEKGAQPTDTILKFLVRSGVSLPNKMQIKWDIKTVARKNGLEAKKAADALKSSSATKENSDPN